MWLLILLLTLTLLVAVGLFAMQRRDVVMERLLFGIEGEPEVPEADLSAGDYGLRGAARFRYQLGVSLRTWGGRAVVAAVSAAAGYLAASASGLELRSAIAVCLTSALLGVLASEWILRRAHAARMRLIRRELPSTLELMAAVMEGGLGFEAALAYVLREADPSHPLYFDLDIVNEAMRRGQRRADALRLWAKRCNLAEVADITAALIQSEQTGGSIGRVLHHHARAMLRDNEAEVQRRAERLPVRMLFPMLFTIFPSILVVAALPSFLRVFRVLDDLLGNVARIGGG